MRQNLAQNKTLYPDWNQFNLQGITWKFCAISVQIEDGSLEGRRRTVVTDWNAFRRQSWRTWSKRRKKIILFI